MSDTLQEIEKLNAALEAAKEETDYLRGAPIKVEDELGKAQKYLTEKANKALAKKALNLMVIEEGTPRKAYICVFFGVRVPKDQIESGVQKMSEIVNDLAEKDLIHSALAPMISLDLIRMPFEVQTSAVCSYVLVPQENVEELKKHEYFVDEGASNLKTLGNTKVELHDGVVGTVIRLSYVLLGNPVASLEDRLQAEIDEYLKVMPKGTTVLSTEKLAITDLSVPYEVKFLSPLLQKAKRVELSHVREVAVVDGKLEQFNLLLGVRYYDKDGKDVYGR